MEIYINNMIVKIKSFKEHMIDLREVFLALQKYQMKLNLAKCAFFICGGKFLGYKVSGRGIEQNLKKFQAILDMPVPLCVRIIQKAYKLDDSIDRFMSKLT